ncbi:hypothetical protein DFH09DRAFT_259378 [Mycena vulgaris]|nr:hypothetical protein DFH09DRAFT_259378 [Mycena vulgaris]
MKADDDGRVRQPPPPSLIADADAHAHAEPFNSSTDRCISSSLPASLCRVTRVPRHTRSAIRTPHSDLLGTARNLDPHPLLVCVRIHDRLRLLWPTSAAILALYIRGVHAARIQLCLEACTRKPTRRPSTRSPGLRRADTPRRLLRSIRVRALTMCASPTCLRSRSAPHTATTSDCAQAFVLTMHAPRRLRLSEPAPTFNAPRDVAPPIHAPGLGADAPSPARPDTVRPAPAPPDTRAPRPAPTHPLLLVIATAPVLVLALRPTRNINPTRSSFWNRDHSMAGDAAAAHTSKRRDGAH